jgi:hypothetical protein
VSASTEDDAPVLERMLVADVLDNWVPGSYDWGWPEERADLTDDPVTAAVRARVDAEGIGFHDHIAPILLGSDGRVWDGHHRLIIALERGIEYVNVEVVR